MKNHMNVKNNSPAASLNSDIQSLSGDYNRSLGAIIARRATPALALAGGMLMATAAQATTILVSFEAVDDNQNNSNCSLIEAIRAAEFNTAVDACPAGEAANRDVIILDGSTFNLTTAENNTYGSNGLPVIRSSMVIQGNGSEISRADNAPNFRILAVGGSSNLTLNQTVISGGIASGNNSNGGAIAMYGGNVEIINTTVTGNTADGGGGGIFSASTTSITLRGTTVSNNTAVSGGGIFINDASALLESSTISGNNGSNGGGIFSDTTLDGANATIRNSTISGNSAMSVGGGIYNRDGLTIIQNSTISRNIGGYLGGGVASLGAASAQTQITSSIISGTTNVNDNDVDFVFGDGTNTFVSNGANVIGGGNATAAFNSTADLTGDTASGDGSGTLSELAFNAGPTQTHALGAGHPALNRTPNNQCQSTDQRNVPRGNGNCDTGAFEFGATFDFGDAQDPTFPTLINNNGAAHVIGSEGPRLGTIAPDAEPNALANAGANGDDNGNTDDEDGLTVSPNPIIIGEEATITLNVSNGNGFVNTWLDLDMNGNWNALNEQLTTNLFVTGGSPETVTFTVPANTPAGAFTARVRVSSASGLSTRGVAIDGEVEDYVFNVVAAGDGGGGDTGGGDTGGGDTGGGDTGGGTPPVVGSGGGGGGGGGGGCALDSNPNQSSARDPLLWVMALLAGMGIVRRKAKNRL